MSANAWDVVEAWVKNGSCWIRERCWVNRWYRAVSCERTGSGLLLRGDDWRGVAGRWKAFATGLLLQVPDDLRGPWEMTNSAPVARRLRPSLKRAG